MFFKWDKTDKILGNHKNLNASIERSQLDLFWFPVFTIWFKFRIHVSSQNVEISFDKAYCIDVKLERLNKILHRFFMDD